MNRNKASLGTIPEQKFGPSFCRDLHQYVAGSLYYFLITQVSSKLRAFLLAACYAMTSNFAALRRLPSSMAFLMPGHVCPV